MAKNIFGVLLISFSALSGFANHLNEPCNTTVLDAVEAFARQMYPNISVSKREVTDIKMKDENAEGKSLAKVKVKIGHKSFKAKVQDLGDFQCNVFDIAKK